MDWDGRRCFGIAFGNRRPLDWIHRGGEDEMKRFLPAISFTTLVCISSVLVWAQAPQPYPPQGAPPTYPQGVPPAPTYSPQELDQLVAPYALYPDPQLAQVLTASTFSSEIPDADGWARSHAYLNGDAL